MNDKKMSFLPDDYIRQRLERRTNIICLSLFGVVLAGVVGAYLVTTTRRAAVLNRQKQITADYDEAVRRITQLDELQEQRRALLRKAEITSTLIERVPRSNLLAELINRMPDSLSLEELDLESERIMPSRPPDSKLSAMKKAQKVAKGNEQDTPPEPQVPRYRVKLSATGLAPTDIHVAQYMTGLARCDLIETVELAFSEEKRVDGLEMRRFSIDMTVSPDADVRLIEPLHAESSRPVAAAPKPGGLGGLMKRLLED